MNIIEALEAGNGKATLFDVGITHQYVQRKEGGQFYWITQIPLIDFLVDGKDLMRNDWRAYVPRETLPTCLDCGQKLPRLLNGAETPTTLAVKTKRSEVFKEIKLSKLQDSWDISNLQYQGIIYYPLFLDMESYEKFRSLYGKSHMTMIIEWEELCSPDDYKPESK